MSDKLAVGIADMKMAQGSGMLVTYALGSCTGICFYDPMLELITLLHIMLPLNLGTGQKSLLKYADISIREMLREAEWRGAKWTRVTAKIAGGVHMFKAISGRSLGNIGQQNIENVHMTLRTEDVRLLQEGVNDMVTRALLFDATTG